MLLKLRAFLDGGSQYEGGKKLRGGCFKVLEWTILDSLDCFCHFLHMCK